MKIATVGDNCIDYYGDTNQSFPGGNPVNVAVYFRRYHEASSYTGVVGNDAFGDVLIESLQSKGVDITKLRRKEGKTAVTQVRLVDGERVFGEYDVGVQADFSLTEDDINFLASHDMVVSGYYGMVENQLSRIKEKNVEIAFDFSTFLTGAVVEKALPFVDIAFFSNDKLDLRELKVFMSHILQHGPKIVVVTRGEKGSCAFDGTHFYQHGIVETEVIDTMGAGDSYLAGFLYGYLSGFPIEKCMKFGSENSAITLKYQGAW